MAPSFPPPPVTTIDWSNVGFRVREVNGHIESHYSKKTGQWSEPKFVEDPYLRIHGMAPALNYGVQCYEGLKAFRTADGQINIFRPDQNAKRLQHSASFVSIPEVPVDHFIKSCELAVGLNAAYVPPHESGAAMYVRPLLIGSSAQLGLNPPEEYTFLVYVLPTGVYHGVHPVDALILEHFDRAAPEGTGTAKIGGNYGPVLRWSDKARSAGYDITLHLDSKTRTVIDEFTTSAFIGVKKDGSDVTLVIPDGKSAIKSVTSSSVQDIARSLGWKVETRPIAYEELSSFQEVIAAGTAAALVPIKSITKEEEGNKIQYNGGSEEPGEIVVKLLKDLKDIQRGIAEDKFGWLHLVPEPKGYTTEGSNGDANGVNTVDQLP